MNKEQGRQIVNVQVQDWSVFYLRKIKSAGKIMSALWNWVKSIDGALGIVIVALWLSNSPIATPEDEVWSKENIYAPEGQESSGLAKEVISLVDYSGF